MLLIHKSLFLNCNYLFFCSLWQVFEFVSPQKNYDQRAHTSFLFAFGLLVHHYSTHETKSFLYSTGRALIFHPLPFSSHPHECVMFSILTQGSSLAGANDEGRLGRPVGKLRLFVSHSFFSIFRCSDSVPGDHRNTTVHDFAFHCAPHRNT